MKILNSQFSILNLLPALFFFFASFLSPLPVSAEKSGGTGSGAHFTIIYSGNTLEEIKPCGCTKEADFGGLLRRGTAIKKIKEKEENVLIMDAGDNLKGTNPQGLLKSELIARGLLAIGYDAVVPGENDFKYGPTFFQTEGFSGWLSSNLVYNKTEFNKIILKELPQGIRVGIIGLIDGGLFSFRNPSHMGISIVPPKVYLKKSLDGLIKENHIDIPVLLLHATETLAREIYEEFQELRIIIVGHTENPDNEEPKTPIIQNGRGLFFADNRGRRLGKIIVRGTHTIHHQWVPLDDSFPDDPIMEPLFAEYKQKVKKLFLEKTETRKKQREFSPYVSVKECEPCHGEMVKNWKTTGHAHAMGTLKKVKQSFDPECIQCHVVGFERGGYVSENITPELGGVQCESCHGPAKIHIEDPSAHYGKLTKETCMTCHTKTRDPEFSFEPNWEKIRH